MPILDDQACKALIDTFFWIHPDERERLARFGTPAERRQLVTLTLWVVVPLGLLGLVILLIGPVP